MNSILSLTNMLDIFFLKRPLRDQALRHSKYVYSELLPLTNILAQISAARAWFLLIRSDAESPGGSHLRPGPQQAPSRPSRSQAAPSAQGRVNEPERCSCCLDTHHLDTQTHSATLKFYTPARHSTDCSPLPAKYKPEETDTWEKQPGPSSISIF